MKRNRLRITACLLLAGTVLAAFVAMAADVGSKNDPLVTLSYLNETFLGQIMEKVELKLADRNVLLREELDSAISEKERQLLREFGGSSASGGTAYTYTAVTLEAGMRLYGGAGCEILLRSGAAVCDYTGGSVPGLVDTTGGGSINGGSALVKDHLYIMPDARSVTVSAASVILVRGDYSLG